MVGIDVGISTSRCLSLIVAPVPRELVQKCDGSLWGLTNCDLSWTLTVLGNSWCVSKSPYWEYLWPPPCL